MVKMSSEWWSWLWQASGCLTLLYILYWLLLRHEKCLVFNRVFLLASTVLSLVVPFADWPGLLSVPALTGPAEKAAVVVLLRSLVVAAQPQGLVWPIILLMIYGAVAGALLIRLSITLTRLIWHARTHFSHRVEDAVLIDTAGKFPTFSFFHLIFWHSSQALSPAQEQQVLQHEAAHGRQWHSLDLLWMELYKAVFWFHPVVYLVQRSLQQTHEYLADEAVRQKTDADAYVQLLLRQTLRQAGLTLANSFYSSSLSGRLRMLRRESRPGRERLRAVLVLCLSGAVLLAYAARRENVPVNNLSGTIPASERAPVTGPATLPSETVYVVVEQMPEFIGGTEGLLRFLGEEVRYPEAAVAATQQGTVFIQFVVQPNGSISEPEVIKGVSPELNAEAIRVVQLTAGKWQPGRQNGRAVSVRYVLPVRFSLS